MRRLITSCALLVLLLPAIAYPADKYTSYKENGYWWQDASAAERLAFVSGIRNGLEMSNAYAAAPTANVVKVMGKTPLSELVAEFTEFYKADENAVIPIQSVWIYQLGKANGLPKAQLDDILLKLRTILAH
jgi:hypothetical protein